MANRAKQIKYIVVHCQAGTGTLESMQKYWKESLDWNSPGYHRWVDFDGTIHELQNYNKPSNGVAGFNSECLHVCYRGGIALKNAADKKYVAQDTRTQAQKDGLLKVILDMQIWLHNNGNDMQNVMILGHYHFSTDQNKNGAIESWERIKECPSFDAYAEYSFIMEKENPLYHKLKLPKNR